jgi:hypothetical protein
MFICTFELMTLIHWFLSCSPELLLLKIFLVILPTRILRRYFQLLGGMVIGAWKHLFQFFFLFSEPLKSIIFFAYCSVISIRTCYPQIPNGAGPATNRSAKLDMLFANKVTSAIMTVM